jgi:DinB family protein
MLRHALATLAYRAAKALRDAPPEFSGFAPAPGSRTAGQILAHMGDLMDWGASIARGQQAWKDSPVQAWDADVQRFFAALERFDDAVADLDPDDPLEPKLFQGAIADALQHTGQLTMMRRLAGAPIRGENYAAAAITIGRVGLDQEPPRREF